ncbi:esterase/lipase family protein [Vibrio sp. RC27]
MSKAIIIVHGLFMSPTAMRVIELRFRKLGYDTYNFGYSSRHYSHKVLDRLHALCCSLKHDNVYFLGHSLGGIVINQYLGEYQAPANCKSVVTLGTPYHGSKIAQYFSTTPYRDFLFGHDKTSQVLSNGVSEFTRLPIGVIIGTKNIGVGLAFGIERGDGTVDIKEATFDGATDQVLISLTHTALIYSKQSVKLAHSFFMSNKFK